jgi:tricorn protease
MKTLLILLSLVLLNVDRLAAQVDARLFRYPDVSATHITFVYAGDLWIAARSGGTAFRLASPDGEEMWPKFSPDGNSIAFTGNYQGNPDIYVIPAMGGVPRRLTWHGMSDQVMGWHPEGDRVLFTSARESGRQRFSQFFTVGLEGGMPEKLPVPYGEFGTFSPDGKRFAYTDKSRLYRTWKRYRGGMAPDIVLFNLEDYGSELIVPDVANDELPMWQGDRIYFLSDRGESRRFNIWVHDLASGSTRQMTDFADYDVHFPSIGPDAIVFEAGGRLHLLELVSGRVREVPVQVVSDQQALLPRLVPVKGFIQSADLAPDGKRVLIEARGDLFSVPAEHGFIRNLTNSPGAADRYPAWSPDGKHIAYWSDRGGEYELILRSMEDDAEKILSSPGAGYRYSLYWSPDSKKLAWIDHAMQIRVYEIVNNRTIEVDQDLWLYHGGLANFRVSWSSDSRWLAYSRGLESRNGAIFLYDFQKYTRHQVTSGYYNDAQAAFDPEGKYLYLLTDRQLGPSYSAIDNSFIYANSTRLAAIPLRRDVASPLKTRNDEVTVEADETVEASKDKSKDSKKEKGKAEEVKKEDEPAIEIEVEGMESRLVLLPVPAGNYMNLQAVKGKVIVHRFPNTGASDRQRPVLYYDLEKREEKTIVGDADFLSLAARGENILVGKNGNMAVVDIAPDQKMDKALALDNLLMMVDPKAEWKQIFTEAWRLQRDYFYDKQMHGLDWPSVRDRYMPLIEASASRWDVNFVIGEMIGELNASHTYRGGGDLENAKRMGVGYLGVDWAIADGHYRIARIIKAGAWDSEARSALDVAGLDVREGDFVLAVNGIPMTIGREPHACFQGLDNKTVELTVNSQPTLTGARKVWVETMSDESELRNLAWIEQNRAWVDKMSGGRIGYIYVQSTGIDGQTDLIRQFNGQVQKEGLIIDERFNSGGQIPDRFIELLNRKPLAYWAVRDGADWSWPPKAHFGPKAMLINGWSGSGGDAFPDYFRKTGLGPLIGTRTWGGLIGITGAPQLIDGGSVTVPTFRMYDPDGTWFREGHGVDPDVHVWENPTSLARGEDDQLRKALEMVMAELEARPYRKPQRPSQEVR